MILYLASITLALTAGRTTGQSVNLIAEGNYWLAAFAALGALGQCIMAFAVWRVA